MLSWGVVYYRRDARGTKRRKAEAHVRADTRNARERVTRANERVRVPAHDCHHAARGRRRCVEAKKRRRRTVARNPPGAKLHATRAAARGQGRLRDLVPDRLFPSEGVPRRGRDVVLCVDIKFYGVQRGSLVDFHTGGPTRTRRTTPNAPRGCRGASSRPATYSHRSRRRRSRPRQPPRSRSSAKEEAAGTSAAR